MTAIRAQATRWLTDDFPGWAEVIIVDADGQRRTIAEKVSVLGDDSLTSTAEYPRSTLVPCSDGEGAGEGRVRVTLLHGVTTECGETTFVLDASSISRE